MQASTKSVQFNVRIPLDLKKAGDETLARVGSSPTQVVRAVWQKLAQGTQGFSELDDILVGSPDPDRAAAIDAKLAALGHGGELSTRFCESLELDAAVLVAMTDDELREARYDELVAIGEARPS